MQPVTSLIVNVSFNIIIPPKTAKTAYELRISVASIGFVALCPKICNV